MPAYIWIFLAILTLSHGAKKKDHKEILPRWDHEVYNGDHFDDIIMTSSQEVNIFTILVLYTLECRHLFDEYGIDHAHIPPTNFLIFAKHNYDKAKREPWYDLDPQWDLKARYGNTDECFEVLFFNRSFTRETKPLKWDPKNDLIFEQWLWSHMNVEVRQAL